MYGHDSVYRHPQRQPSQRLSTLTATTKEATVSRTKYPWQEWADGGVHGLRLHPDEDPEAVERVRNALYVYGKRHDLSVRTRLDDEQAGTVLLRFQLLPENANAEDFAELFWSNTLGAFDAVPLDDDGSPVAAGAA